MRTGWIITAGGLAALFATFGIQSLSLPLRDELGPGPGFFPLAISVFGLALACLLAFQTWRTQEAISAVGEGASGRFRLIAILGAIVVAISALEFVGYTLTALVLIPAILLVLGARSKIAIISVSLAMSFGVFHIFYFWLNVALPIGLLGI